MFSFAETALSDADRCLLKIIADAPDGFGIQLPEGKMLDAAIELARRGFVDMRDGYFSISRAGRSMLRPNDKV